MGFRAIEPVQITGLLSASSTTFANGWNNVNISTVTTIPAPATAVLFYIVNDSSGSQAAGIRHANNTANVVAISNFAGGRISHFIATLEGSSGSTFSFNTDSNTAVKFFVGGFFHELTVFEPQNRITNATSTNSWQTKTINEVPTGTTYILNGTVVNTTQPNNIWREVGGSVEYPCHGYISFIKLNSNKQFEVNVSSSSLVEVWGYTDKNWLQPVATLTGNTMANTAWSANNNWNDFPYLYPNKTGVLVFQDDGWNASHTGFLRKKGSSWSIARAGNQPPTSLIVEPDANGAFQYWIENVTPNTGSFVVSTLFTETVPDYTLTDVNTTESVVAGQDSVVFSGRGLSTVDKIRIASNTRSISKNVTSANATTVIASIPTDSELFSSNVTFGNITFSVEVSGNAVANLSGTLALSEQYGQHDVINVSQNTNSNTIYFAQIPAVKVGDKIAHDSITKTYGWGATIDSNGFVSVSSTYSTQSDNLSYRIYSTEFQEWSTPGTVTIQSPYINARANSVRVTKSVDGKRYSRYVDGSGPRYNPTIIVRSQAALNSALSLSQEALSGQVIGVEYNTTPYFMDETIISGKTFASGLTICQYGSRMPVFNYIRVRGLVNTKLSGIDLYKASNGTCLTINSGTDNFTFEYSKIHSTYWDPNGNYGAYEPSATQASAIKLVSSGAGANIANVYITNNQIYNVLEGLTTSQGFTGDFHFIGNEVYNMYTGGLAFGSQNPNTGTTKINWNYMHSAYGLSSDANIGLGTPPHVDYIQPRAVQSDWTLEIVGNILVPGNSRGGNFVQCIFLDDQHVVGDNTHFYTANVIGNLCVTNSTHAISILQSKNSRVIGNSVLPASSSATIGAKVSVGTGTASYPDGDGGGNIVKNTVAETINGNLTETNNYEYNSYSAAVLATLFVGPTFSGSTWYTKQGALSATSMLIGGPLDLATNIGSVGTGYVDFTNRTINTSME